MNSTIHPLAVEAARLTGVHRYLQLLDSAHPDYDPRWLPVVEKAVAEHAGAGDAPKPDAPWSGFVRITGSMRARINTCPYRECRTGCQRSKCWAGKGDPRWGDVSMFDCAACLGAAGD